MLFLIMFYRGIKFSSIGNPLFLIRPYKISFIWFFSDTYRSLLIKQLNHGE